jgi:nitroimidazol reductase NimA-like FMN-containing flavoprotein (pyridoxamine 5'-phosphate oxidase superfamily)
MSDPSTLPRRRDRALQQDPEIESLLHRLPIGFVAVSDHDQPYLNPNLFWYDAASRRIYFHTAAKGRTRDTIERNPQVCFSAAEQGTLLPAATALDFSTAYASVIAFGRARIVDDDVEQRHGLQGLLDKYFPDLHPGVDYRPIVDDELQRTTVYAIDIEAWSGKRKPEPNP